MEPEALWERLLSNNNLLIRHAWESIGEEERAAVKQHLLTMARETGWHPDQRRAALAALQCINDLEEK
jgi:hypothetical protein